ncbi:hypothetical protein AZ78_4752 [Lysobacter capsici AZ78]|uniref:Uncharacterized protein n=1 Tax=Lysobacter capsici AZ78 TaxID=1444315 RepID=A0A120AI46_9GAMM|nr:hypothetical protein AZ78_4752 [Lysobacter capsici AZ78]
MYERHGRFLQDVGKGKRRIFSVHKERPPGTARGRRRCASAVQSREGSQTRNGDAVSRVPIRDGRRKRQVQPVRASPAGYISTDRAARARARDRSER